MPRKKKTDGPDPPSAPLFQGPEKKGRTVKPSAARRQDDRTAKSAILSLEKRTAPSDHDGGSNGERNTDV